MSASNRSSDCRVVSSELFIESVIVAKLARLISSGRFGRNASSLNARLTAVGVVSGVPDDQFSIRVLAMSSEGRGASHHCLMATPIIAEATAVAVQTIALDHLDEAPPAAVTSEDPAPRRSLCIV